MDNDFRSLTDTQWAFIEGLMDQNLPPERGTPRANLRSVWNSILYLLSQGCRWIDIPNDRSVYAARATAHAWMLRWQYEGVFDRVLSGLLQLAVKQKKIDLTQVSVDGLFPPAPGGGSEVGRGYKGKGVLLHLLVDNSGLPLAMSSTPANGDERRQVLQLLQQSQTLKHRKTLCSRPMMVLQADKGYDASWLRQELIKRKIFPFIPRRQMGKPSPDRPRTREVAETFHIKSNRWAVERAFAWLKRKFRRLMLRWERLPVAWNAFVTLALIRYWQQLLIR